MSENKVKWHPYPQERPIEDDEYFTINETTTWKELLRDYTFLDNSPCGKEVEDV